MADVRNHSNKEDLECPYFKIWLIPHTNKVKEDYVTARTKYEFKIQRKKWIKVGNSRNLKKLP